MFHRILHANDGSGNAFKALEAAVEITAVCHAKLDIIFVEELSPRSGTIGDVAERKAEQDRLLRKWHSMVAKCAMRHGVHADTHVFAGHPVPRIIAFARDAGSDLLVIGATEHADLGEMIFGRRADRMMHQAPCSVLVVR